jgi:hypothetical protein
MDHWPQAEGKGKENRRKQKKVGSQDLFTGTASAASENALTLPGLSAHYVCL